MRSRACALVGLVLVVILSLAASARPAAACSCEPATPVEHASTSDAVFTGTITSIRPTERNFYAIPPTQPPPTYFPAVSTVEMFEVQLRTETIFKGPILSTVVVVTSRDSGGACGFPFELGRRYTVFADLLDGELRTSSCSATALGTIDPAAYELPAGIAPTGSQPTAATAPEAAPAPAPSPAPSPANEAGPAFALVIGGLVAIGAFFALRRRRAIE